MTLRSGKTRAVSNASWERFGNSWAVLVRLGGAWGHLGSILGRLGVTETLIFLWFFNDFRNNDVLNRNGRFGRS